MNYFLTYKLYEGAETVGRVYHTREEALEKFDAAVSMNCIDVTLVANHKE